MIGPLTVDDIPRALELCRHAGWNQLHDDWLRLIEHEPNGCFAAEVDGQLAGTVTTTRHGTQLAWIGMMLVDEHFRRQGIGTQLMTASLEYLRAAGVGCIKLDATPAGQPVYERLGFQYEAAFHRWARESDQPAGHVGESLGDSQNSPSRIDAATCFSEGLLELDRIAFGADRSSWLCQLAAGSRVVVRPGGYGMLRPGFLANYLGSVTAETPEVAKEIIGKLLSDAIGLTFWDVPHGNLDAVQLAQSFGFEPVRDLTRMVIGSNPVTPAMNLQYALTDPGTG